MILYAYLLSLRNLLAEFALEEVCPESKTGRGGAGFGELRSVAPLLEWLPSTMTSD